MSKERFDLIHDDLAARKSWEDRQALYYEMRHDGLPRKSKPWPYAADLHFPLIDSMIEKHKPFYYQIIFSTDLVATFLAIKTQYAKQATSASQWFDFKLKQKTNLERECLAFIDFMLMAGRSVCKVFWDEKVGQVRFEAIDPTYFIIPSDTRDIQDADRMCHVQKYSVDSYKRNKNFRQDPEFIKSITGQGDDFDTIKNQSKDLREGISYGRKDEIIVWEYYTRDEKGWKISWFSPVRPNEPVRADQRLIYRHGMAPYVDFLREVKDAGWYSPRGIPDLVKHDEAYLTKMMNEKADALTLYNRPIYTSQGAIPNVQNLKLVPGQVIPMGLQRVDPGAAPVGFDGDIQLHRALAEYRVGMPDFGIGKQDQGDKSRTATEVNAIAGLMGLNMDLRGRIFKSDLGRLLTMAWELYKQFDSKSLGYWFGSEGQSLDPTAFEGEYAIIPNGSADGVNRQGMLQRAVARMQMFNGDSLINQRELRTSVLELDDPRLIKRLMIDPGDQGYDQAEEQADEINNMLIGFPVRRSAPDDDVAHLSTLVMYLEKLMQTQKPPTIEAGMLLMKHGAEHTQAVNQTQEGRAFMKEWRPRIERVVGWLMGLGEAAKQAGMMPGQQAQAPVQPQQQGVPQ